MAESKKAKILEIDPERPLSHSEYDELLRHGRNSSLWYLGRFPSHSTRIRQRLYEKGYPRGAVQRENSEGALEPANLVDEIMEELELLHMLDDRLYIESKLKSTIAKGRGTSLAVRELKHKGIPEEEIEAVLEDLEDELTDELSSAVARAAEKIMRSSPFRKAQQPWQKSMVLSGYLRAKGFDRAIVDSWMESNSEIFGEFS